MCVGFWSLTHPAYALILCTNRDEDLARPTAPAHFHSFAPIVLGADDDSGRVLAGRDLQAGGTWFGLSRAGRLALLTNITEPAAAYASSRGALVSSVLLAPTGSMDLDTEVADLLAENAHTAYAGFNLLLLAPTVPAGGALSFDAQFVSNFGGGGRLAARPLTGPERACGGMSNGIDGQGADAWPKVVHGTTALNSILHAISPDATDEQLAAELFALLTARSSTPPRDRSELKNTVHVAPLTMRVAPDAAAHWYGTRLATVVLIRRDGRALFIERDMWQLDASGAVSLGDASRQREYRFNLELQPALGLEVPVTAQR
ncbi:DUF833-domain-containing protein [Auriscalpium vulgare]|uniref:DUF833-domain-containing protein n=1 Tax=Auriscalpium vulgare TaxID=40419 RepID=A0ACB8RCY1_9AGAM|nr:DUF833-domain-containing protein [Auriscalpium vulgare]